MSSLVYHPLQTSRARANHYLPKQTTNKSSEKHFQELVKIPIRVGGYVIRKGNRLKRFARKVADDGSESGILGPFASGVLSLRGKIISPQRSGSNIEAIEEGYILEIITDLPAALHFHSLAHYSW